MPSYTYYLLDDGRGAPYAIYRGVIGKSLHKCGLERAKRDGAWSSAGADVNPLLDLWLKGDFVPEDAEISEGNASSLLEDMRSTTWPGWP